MAWHKDTKTIKLNTAMEISTWRQILQKENTLMKHKAKKELTAMEDQLYRKNNYMHLYKNKDTIRKESIAEKTGKDIVFVYDQTKNDEEEKDGYCQKCKRESLWCKDRVHRDEPKAKLEAPLTTSQSYGWRQPIDDMQTGFARSAVCKRTFVDQGHL